MMPGLGTKYAIEIETISRPMAEYQTDEYYASDLPIAPAIIVNGEKAIEGGDIKQERLEAMICRHLGLDAPEEKKGFFGNIFGNT